MMHQKHGYCLSSLQFLIGLLWYLKIKLDLANSYQIICLDTGTSGGILTYALICSKQHSQRTEYINKWQRYCHRHTNKQRSKQPRGHMEEIFSSCSCISAICLPFKQGELETHKNKKIWCEFLIWHSKIWYLKFGNFSEENMILTPIYNLPILT